MQPISANASKFRQWITLRGASRGTTVSCRRSFSVTSAARSKRFSEKPDTMPATVFMLQGTIAIPSARKVPLAMELARSSGAQFTSARDIKCSGPGAYSNSAVLLAAFVITRKDRQPGSFCRCSSTAAAMAMPEAPLTPITIFFSILVFPLSDTIIAKEPVPVHTPQPSWETAGAVLSLRKER